MPESAVRKSDPMPYYAQLAQILRKEIQRGRWKPGDMLPSEAKLCEMYEISRTAVRQALDELVDEGLVQKEKGRGTFVSQPTTTEFVVQELRGFFEEMTQRGEQVRTDVLGQELVTTPPEVVPELQLRMGDKCLRLDRIRRIDATPIVVVHTHLPAALFGELVDRDMRDESLYRILSEEYDVHPGGGRRRFEAVTADEATAGALDLPTGAAVLKLTAVNFDQDDVPFEHFVAWYRGDLTAFDVLVEPMSGHPDAVLDVDTRSQRHEDGE